MVRIRVMVVFCLSLVVGILSLTSCQSSKQTTMARVVNAGKEDSQIDATFQSEDGKVWMALDTIHQALVGYVDNPNGVHADTLDYYEQYMEIYPKGVHNIQTDDGATIYLFLYSRGRLLCYDEALTCIIDNYSLKPASFFEIEEQRDSVVGCMWYDQLVAASDGFPYDILDEDRFGIHYDTSLRRLYLPIMEHHEKESDFENCLRYTGRFDVLRFDGKVFVPDGTDGAWWLNKKMRNYKRTISCQKVGDDYVQIDEMPDGTFRQSVWKHAKDYDNLQKTPDAVRSSFARFH